MKKTLLLFYFIIIIAIYGFDSDTSIKELSVNNENLMLNFFYNSNDEIYITVVSCNTTFASVNVNPYNSKSSAIYNNNLKLHFGVNETGIIIVAENGNKKKYILKIVRPKSDTPSLNDLEIQKKCFLNINEYFSKLKYLNIENQDNAIKQIIHWILTQPEVAHVITSESPDNKQVNLRIIFNSGIGVNYTIYVDLLPSIEKKEIDKYFVKQFRITGSYEKSVKNLIDWLLSRKDIFKVSIIGSNENATLLALYFIDGRSTRFIATKGECLVDKYFSEQFNLSNDLNSSINKLIIWIKENKDFKLVKKNNYENMVVISMQYKEGRDIDYVIQKSDYFEKWNINNAEE